jgi:nitric oxide reductase NorQ protein
MKDLKQSTKQRFTGFDFDYPEAALEAQIVARKPASTKPPPRTLVKIARPRATSRATASTRASRRA